jgi:hypothetical protein
MKVINLFDRTEAWAQEEVGIASWNNRKFEGFELVIGQLKKTWRVTTFLKEHFNQ